MFLSVILVILSVVSLPLNTAATSSDEPVYKKVGDTIVLSPGLVTDPITYIMWRHGPDIAMEWSNNHTESYRQFKDRGSLNSVTGELTIKGLTRNDSGSYTSEINNRVTNKTQLLVFSPVSKPTVSTWCEEDMTECVLTCEGNTADAEPITFTWSTGDGVRLSSTREYSITKSTLGPWFSCTLQNPVSSESSEQVINPLFLWFQVGVAIAVLISAAVTLFCIYVICKCVYKKRRGIRKVLFFILGLHSAVLLIACTMSSISLHKYRRRIEFQVGVAITVLMSADMTLSFIYFICECLYKKRRGNNATSGGIRKVLFFILGLHSAVLLIACTFSSIMLHKYRRRASGDMTLLILGLIYTLLMIPITIYIIYIKIEITRKERSEMNSKCQETADQDQPLDNQAANPQDVNHHVTFL